MQEIHRVHWLRENLKFISAPKIVFDHRNSRSGSRKEERSAFRQKCLNLRNAFTSIFNAAVTESGEEEIRLKLSRNRHRGIVIVSNSGLVARVVHNHAESIHEHSLVIQNQQSRNLRFAHSGLPVRSFTLDADDPITLVPEYFRVSIQRSSTSVPLPHRSHYKQINRLKRKWGSNDRTCKLARESLKA